MAPRRLACACPAGVTLIELLVTVIIGSIAFFALAIPFVAERSFSSAGRRQVEAQRDAQLAMRLIARRGRESGGYTVDFGGSGVTFLEPEGGTCDSHIQGGPAIGGRLELDDGCTGGPTAILIDGIRSQVTDFLVEGLSFNLIRVRITVTHENQRDELVETEILLRNAT